MNQLVNFCVDKIERTAKSLQGGIDKITMSDIIAKNIPKHFFILNVVKGFVFVNFVI